MGTPLEANNVLRILAAFSRDEKALTWAVTRGEEQWGACALASPVFEFTETDYYSASMGGPLLKAFWAFKTLAAPAELAQWKLQTNLWETEFAQQHPSDVVRPLNLDPGYLTLGKLVLASTKDHAHRIYLQHGIYAEVTLGYRNRGWHNWEWTYPDYRREDVQAFFLSCRDYLRSELSPRAAD